MSHILDILSVGAAALHSHLILVITLLFAGQLLRTLFLNPLRKVPGPRLARLTKLWKFQKAVRGDMEWTNIRLHNQYGGWVLDRALGLHADLQFKDQLFVLRPTRSV